MKKIISVLLVLAMLAGMLISCGDKNAAKDGGDNSTTNAPAGEQTPAVEQTTAAERILPDLPDETFNGYVFTFLTHSDGGDDWPALNPLEIVAEMQDGKEVQNSEPVNDAVYQRNLTIKEKYKIDIKMINMTDEKSAMNKAVKSGESIYDAVVIFNNNVQGVVTAGLLMNVSNLRHIDLSKPWWDPAVNAMSIDRKNYLLGGDLLLLDNEATNALLFNKDILANLGKEMPYNLVKSGKWTMDVFNEYIKDASSDLNGDGKITPENDRWGFVAFNDTLHALLVAGGGTLALKDENDLPYMDFTSPRNISVFEKITEIMYNKNDVLNVQSDTPSDKWSAIFYGSFEEGRALFQWVRMRAVEKYRGMEAPFGILPMPKFDENQENYCSAVNAWSGVLLGVPINAAEPDRVSIILEAMAAESRYTVQPAYYDIVLQRKYVRDDESSEMLDIIFNTRVYDIGAVYSFAGVFAGFISLCGKSDTNIVSYYDKNISKMEKAIEKVVKVFQEME